MLDVLNIFENSKISTIYALLNFKEIFFLIFAKLCDSGRFFLIYFKLNKKS